MGKNMNSSVLTQDSFDPKFYQAVTSLSHGSKGDSLRHTGRTRAMKP